MTDKIVAIEFLKDGLPPEKALQEATYAVLAYEKRGYKVGEVERVEDRHPDYYAFSAPVLSEPA